MNLCRSKGDGGGEGGPGEGKKAINQFEYAAGIRRRERRLVAGFSEL